MLTQTQGPPPWGLLHEQVNLSPDRASRPPPRSNYARFNSSVLHRPVQLAAYTSGAFGHRLGEGRLLGSIGTIGDCFDNSVAESFFATLQTRALGPLDVADPRELRQRGLQLRRGFLQPLRRHSPLGYLSPADYDVNGGRNLALVTDPWVIHVRGGRVGVRRG